jgi:hypothetical protein
VMTMVSVFAVPGVRVSSRMHFSSRAGVRSFWLKWKPDALSCWFDDDWRGRVWELRSPRLQSKSDVALAEATHGCADGWTRDREMSQGRLQRVGW